MSCVKFINEKVKLQLASSTSYDDVAFTSSSVLLSWLPVWRLPSLQVRLPS
jgi:hypothetical protein